jgi:hypothetical protein
VFFFARHGAGVTSNTTVLIYDKTVSHLLKVTLAWRSDCKTRHHS